MPSLEGSRAERSPFPLAMDEKEGCEGGNLLWFAGGGGMRSLDVPSNEGTGSEGQQGRGEELREVGVHFAVLEPGLKS